MSRIWTLLTHVHALAAPMLVLLYPLYASVMAIDSPAKDDDEQWLAYWIIYSFLKLAEMLFQSILEWIPIWESVKLVLAAWLVLPQFRGAAFIYERFAREHMRRYAALNDHHQSHKKRKSPVNGKNKFVRFIVRKKVS